MLNYLKQRIKSFGYAFKGMADFLSGRHPHALIHLTAVVVVCIAGFFFKISAFEWLIILVCFALVLSLEAMNSALEYLVDLVSPEKHPLAGKSKDMAAAAVLISAIIAVIIAAIIFIPKMISL